MRELSKNFLCIIVVLAISTVYVYAGNNGISLYGKSSDFKKSSKPVEEIDFTSARFHSKDQEEQSMVSEPFSLFESGNGSLRNDRPGNGEGIGQEGGGTPVQIGDGIWIILLLVMVYIPKYIYKHQIHS